MWPWVFAISSDIFILTAQSPLNRNVKSFFYRPYIPTFAPSKIYTDEKNILSPITYSHYYGL